MGPLKRLPPALNRNNPVALSSLGSSLAYATPPTPAIATMTRKPDSVAQHPLGDFQDMMAAYGLQGCEVSDTAAPCYLPEHPYQPLGFSSLAPLTPL